MLPAGRKPATFPAGPDQATIEALRGRYAFTAQALGETVDLAESRVSDREEMACFDDLPPALRDALVEHPEKVTAQSVLGRLQLLRRRLGAGAETRVLEELAALAALRLGAEGVATTHRPAAAANSGP